MKEPRLSQSAGSLLAALCLLIPTPALPAQEEAVSDAPSQEETATHGRSAAFDFGATSEDGLDLPAGSRLFQYPDARSRVLDVLASTSRAVVLEEHGSWAKIRHESWVAWVWTDGDLPVEATPVLALPVARPDEERLRRARQILGDRESAGVLGPFRLYTDVDDGALLELLRGAAADVVRAYSERYGLEPELDGGEALVLFEREKDYRRYEADEPAIAGLGTLGHTTAGLSVMFTGGRHKDAVRQLLLHELVHLLNARALGRQVAPWLEEGMAEDLSFSAADAEGGLRLGTLGRQGMTITTVTRGARGVLKMQSPRQAINNPFGATPHASLAWLLHEWNSAARPSVELLVDLPWVGFVQPGYRQFYYGQSGFLVRYLLDGEGEESGDRLRRYLAGLVAGGSTAGAELWRQLDTEPAALEESFHRWLWRYAAANGVPTPR